MATDAISGPYTPAFLRKALDLFEDQRGWLVVSDGARDLCWVCAREGVRAFLRGRRPPTPGRWLALGGGLRPEQEQRVQAARAAAPERGTSLAALIEVEREALQKAGVAPSSLDAASRSLMAQLPVDALFWDEPCADAGVGDPPFAERLLQRDLEPSTATVALPTLLTDVRERLGRAAQTLKALPTAALSAVTTGEAGARKHLAGVADPLERQVLERVLQKPGIHGDQLLQALECGEGQLLARLQRLIDAKVAAVERLPLDGESRQKALAQADAAIQAGTDELPRRLWLAGAAESVKDPLAAARHWTRAGWLTAEQGRASEAAEMFARALRHSPEDVEALQGRIRALWALSREEEAVQLAEPLARQYLELGLPTQAQRVLKRALESRESGTLLELMIQAHLDLADTRGAEKLLESLELQMRQEGRQREAERVRQRVEQARSQGDRRTGEKGTRRAPVAVSVSPGLKAVAALGMLISPGLVGFLYMQRREWDGRDAYQKAAAQAELFLNSDTPGSYDALTTVFPEKLPGSLEVEKRLSAAKLDAQRLKVDHETWLRAKDVLEHTWATDLGLAHSQLQQLEPQSTPLKESIEAMLTRAETTLNNAKKERLRVSSFPRSGDLRPGFEAARAFLADFPNVAHEQDQAMVWIEVASTPPGALIIWRGQPTQQKTPLRIEVPVRGDRELRLELPGHAPFETVIRMAELPDPYPNFKLERQ